MKQSELRKLIQEDIQNIIIKQKRKSLSKLIRLIFQIKKLIPFKNLQIGN